MTEKKLNPVMILLSGGRSTPAILGVLSLKPKAVEYINSADQPDREKEIRATLMSLSDLKDTEPGINVDAYDNTHTVQACIKLRQRHGHDDFVVNLSSGTKLMALGAYEFAKEYGYSAYYVDTNNRRVIEVFSGTSHPLHLLTVKDYLACFNRYPRLKFNADLLSVTMEQASEIAQDLVDLGDPAQEVLEHIRQRGKGKDEPRTCRIKNYEPTPEAKKIWMYLVEIGLLANAFLDGNNYRFTIQRTADYAFLEGGWLELFAWNQARSQCTAQGAPVFDDVAVSFEIPTDGHGAYKEIDVGAMYAGQLIHCSCKAGTNRIWSTDHLDELRAVSSLVGGKFCSRIFITAKNPPIEAERDSHRAYLHFLDQAKAREIVVVAGDQLKDVGKILAQQATRPTYWRV